MQFRFWDMESALQLIQEQYNWFLPTFEAYSSIVAKGEPSYDGCSMHGMTAEVMEASH